MREFASLHKHATTKYNVYHVLQKSCQEKQTCELVESGGFILWEHESLYKSALHSSTSVPACQSVYKQ